jgi:hypothetical protein
MDFFDHLGSALISGLLAWICFRVSAGVVPPPIPLEHVAWGLMAVCAVVVAACDLLIGAVGLFSRGSS